MECIVVKVRNRCVVVTGAASGIGAALARRLRQHEAKNVICADIDFDGAQRVAEEIGGIALELDVSNESDLKGLIDQVETTIAPIDLFCSNAGVLTMGGLDVSDDLWQRSWEINVMSHVWAARHLVPRMVQRGGGYFLNTASAAGLLNQIGAAPYGVTKHAAVGFAEWLAITYGDKGIGVSVLCPQAVRSEMTKGFENSVASLDGLLEPDDVANFTIEALKNKEFLILPHPAVRGYMETKARDTQRWISGMQRLRDRFSQV